MRCRFLIFIVSYNAERTITDVLSRIPRALEQHHTEILIIDDASQDRTFEKAVAFQKSGLSPFPLTVLFNPVNQGYGGNQKVGFHYAIQHGFDVVALLHGDGQYAPEKLPELLHTLLEQEAMAVFGSRMLERFGALRGGMPLYKFIGNKVLTAYQNALLGSAYSEFHSGYRLYRTQALSQVPFHLNTSDFHFDTEIIVQFIQAGLRIVEHPIPTYYGDEICHVNGLKYAWDVVRAVTVARLQPMGIFYQRKFDRSGRNKPEPLYVSKLSFFSSQRLVVDTIPPGANVLDLGCGEGAIDHELRAKGCRVVGIDKREQTTGNPNLDAYIAYDLNRDLPAEALSNFSHVLLLDVVEHLVDPEGFVVNLHQACGGNPDMRLIATTGNVAFFLVRFMLLLGAFRYGRRGILDLTHVRLFTFSSFRQLFEERGFKVTRMRGIPAPYPLAIGNNLLSRTLLRLNRWLIHISRGLFSYQILLELQPLPGLQHLLDQAFQASALRHARAWHATHPMTTGDQPSSSS
ncbi:MAG: glycosyltransferase [Magnetococcales bacterium]|nr:glycosyltransferase [Magnetococcales bacterium]